MQTENAVQSGAKPRGKPRAVKNSSTNFGKWRAKLGITQKQAAELLGQTVQNIIILERGQDYNGRRFPPRLTTRLLMAHLAKHGAVEPWPE